ncbi:PLP-dependent aminotransferase family protein [Thiomonas intermedia]|uniref:aminotransferase-like domain-containing protein n=1 Tax=Thiomonas intermedia TaxID=926 RepID=UPI001FEC1351|nr:PLP-dependent aminotransferase family protein [Thiomonas intermedia]
MMQTMDAHPDTPLYLTLAERLAGLAASGSLRPGARLPSVRALSEQHGVSISTAVQAYRTLEDRGVIEARPKSGFFVRRARKLLPLPTTTRPPARAVAVETNAIADAVLDAAGDPAYISFGAATASEDLYAVERVRRAIARCAQRHASSLGVYATAPGIAPLRQAISRRALELGCSLDHRHVVVTNGCMEAITLCLRAVTQPGDVIAIESPTYFGFLRALQALGLRAVEIPMQPGIGLSLEALEVALDTQPIKAVVAVPTLSNPLGTIMPTARKRRLAELLDARGIPLIEDVICNELVPTEENRRAVRSFDRNGNVMLCGSFGKTLAPGLRGIGWVEAGRWSEQVAALKRALSGGGSAVIEWAVAELLEQGGYDQSLRQLRRCFADQTHIARHIIGAAFPPGSRVTDPAGGFILWVELPRSVDAVALYQRCIEQRIVIVPGTLFTTSNRYRNCLRLNVGGRWTAEREEALRAVGRMATQLAAG